MLSVFICEDHEPYRNQIFHAVENFIFMEDLDMKIVLSTNDPHAIVSFVRDHSPVGLYFLDLELNSDINGITLAEKIREFDPRGFIVFVTAHAESWQLTFQYKVEAMDFIVKDTIADVMPRLCECIGNAYKKYTAKSTVLHPHFTFKVFDRLVSIEFDKILYFETSAISHKIFVHATTQENEFYGKLNDIEKTLDSRFFRCHKSILVNLDMVKQIDRHEKQLLLMGGASCPVSTRAIGKLSKVLNKNSFVIFHQNMECI